MNKKAFALALIPSLLLASCDLLDLFVDELNDMTSETQQQENNSEKQDNNEQQPSGEQEQNQQEEQGKEEEKQPDPITFTIASAKFTDESGQLKVNYTCNYGSPFLVEGHTYSHLNITGVLAREVDSSNEGYFTLLSPIIQTNLKFEFYDTDENVYISERCQNVELYVEETPPGPTIDYPNGYNTLYWSDEFDGASLDQSKWTYEIGNGNEGWGNWESQYYTNRNDSIQDGVLQIKAKKENVESFQYTSTRIKTQNKVRFTYGYVEARIALPTVTGMWPAFWMMPNDSTYGGWPHSGEIDIMEAKGRIPNTSSSAIHFSTDTGDHTYLTKEKSGHNIAEFHKYAVEWKADSISFYIDDVKYFETYKSQWTTVNNLASETAPFDKDFYIILNLAVGGHFDNYQLPPNGFSEASMQVDYVRVFK